jgi:hypothetical protein
MTFMIYTLAYLFVGIAVSTMLCVWLEVKRGDWATMIFVMAGWPVFIAILIGALMARLLEHLTKGDK